MERVNYKVDLQEVILGLVKNPIVYLRMLGVVSQLRTKEGCMSSMT